MLTNLPIDAMQKASKKTVAWLFCIVSMVVHPVVTDRGTKTIEILIELV